MLQLAPGFDAPTLNYGAVRKAGRQSRAPEANWISPTYRSLKVASLRRESSNQLLETLEEWNDYLERVRAPQHATPRRRRISVSICSRHHFVEVVQHEALVSDRARQHSIRVNDQFRICFVWTDTGPTDIEITNHYA
jgi:Txe/YoeB family toxin of Txe-Axe toxin-antitoxin module